MLLSHNTRIAKVMGETTTSSSVAAEVNTTENNSAEAQTKQEAKKPSSKDRLSARYRKSRPDLNWDDESVDNDIYGLAADELDAFDSDRKSREDIDEKMNRLFGSDSRASKIFVDWAHGKDPIENLLETYGDDFIEALQSKEGKERFKESLKKWRESKVAGEEHAKLYDSNIAETAKTLIAFADKNKLSDEQVKGIVDKAHQLTADAFDGKYSEELLEMIYKAGKYDQDVNDAREEGRINGRNETIKRELRESKPKTNLPPTSGGQNATMQQEGHRNPQKRRIDFLGGIDVKKS